MKLTLPVFMIGIVAGITLVTPHAMAHCEIPCGIYGDEMRIQMILEDCQTIEKSMSQIMAMSSEGGKNYNQIMRWVTNKDGHAEKIQQVVTQYFLTQRIKPGENTEIYHRKLELLHGILVEAMKCKQTLDVEHVRSLRQLVESFKTVYFGPAKDPAQP